MSSEQKARYYCEGCESKCEIKIITRYHNCGRPAGTYAKLNPLLATMEIQIDSDFTRQIYIPMLIEQAHELARKHCPSYTKQK